MATTGMMNGDLVLVTADGVAIADTTSFKLTVDRDLPDATTRDSSKAATHIIGDIKWSIAVDGLVDYSSSYGADDLMTAIVNGTVIAAVWGTGVTGDPKYSGNVDVSNLSLDASHNSTHSFAGTLTGKGALTIGTF